MLLVQAPDGAGPLAREAVTTTRRPVLGFLGPWSQVVQAREALGLSRARAAMDSREDLFDLALAELCVPGALSSGEVTFRPLTADDVETFARLQHDYSVEALHETAGEALLESSRATARRQAAAGDAFLLERGGVVVACSTFNARLPDCVQVGGVYVPPRLRKRGYGRAVVAGTLLQAREAGATRAILFTGDDNVAARTAYLALGFRIVGDFGIVLLSPDA
jgi:predicted GNAT family acetyltransferase